MVAKLASSSMQSTCVHIITVHWNSTWLVHVGPSSQKTVFLPAAREPAGPKIALCFLRLSVRLSVRPHLSRAQYYIMRYYATAVYYCTNHFWRLVGQDSTATEYRFVLPRRRKSGRQP